MGEEDKLLEILWMVLDEVYGIEKQRGLINRMEENRIEYAVALGY